MASVYQNFILWIIIIIAFIQRLLLGTVTATAIAAQSQTQREFWFGNKDENRTDSENIFNFNPEASGRSVQKRQNSVSWTQLKMRACKSFARWSGDFEDRVNVLSDDVRALIFQDVGCQTCRDICEERKQCLSFHVRWFWPFDLPELIAAKPRSSFSEETSSTLALMNTTIHSSHITRLW